MPLPVTSPPRSIMCSDALLLEPVEDVEGVERRAEQPVELRRDHHVAGAQHRQQLAAFGRTCSGFEPDTPRSTNTRSSLRSCIMA